MKARMIFIMKTHAEQGANRQPRVAGVAATALVTQCDLSTREAPATQVLMWIALCASDSESESLIVVIRNI